MWTIDQLEINGGFLPGLTLSLPPGLICIIGPRGSGKSTLAEALRFAMRGTVDAARDRVELLQANVGSSGSVTVAAKTKAGVRYTVRRALKQPPTLVSSDGKPVPNVDLDRGTFLPLDAYDGHEIEAIADEVLGDKRRSLLDDLRIDELSTIHLSLAEHRRALEANADQIRAVRRLIHDLSERIEEFGDVRAKLDALGPLPESTPSTEYSKANKQQQCNARERKRIENVLVMLGSFQTEIESIKTRANGQGNLQMAEEGSSNSAFLKKRQAELQRSIDEVAAQADTLVKSVGGARAIADRNGR
jgi:DNA repair exonuclease SbcCD ATPase subunit